MVARSKFLSPGLLFLLGVIFVRAEQARPVASAEELHFWLRNMATHRYAVGEMSEVLALPQSEMTNALRRFGIVPFPSSNALLVLPYPGGRHPRIGFLDGAVDPQRETKISVFTPWDPASYVVVDVPEAIFSNLGLIYLAHTHVPTVWSAKNVSLPALEWKRHADGSLESERTLPNQIAFGARIKPGTNAVLMELWLRNGTDQPLSGLRVQNCVMLKAAAGFNQQTNANKVFADPFVACGSPDGKRWIITAWDHLHRTWANPPVPCIHSDPKFPDCAPATTVRVRGMLSFYEGTNIHAEFKRLGAILNSSFPEKAERN
jgi:hypothetical protein